MDLFKICCLDIPFRAALCSIRIFCDKIDFWKKQKHFMDFMARQSNDEDANTELKNLNEASKNGIEKIQNEPLFNLMRIYYEKYLMSKSTNIFKQKVEEVEPERFPPEIIKTSQPPAELLFSYYDVYFKSCQEIAPNDDLSYYTNLKILVTHSENLFEKSSVLEPITRPRLKPVSYTHLTLPTK